MDTLDRDLEEALRRELPAMRSISNYRLQRLQPVAVPPPPALTSADVETGRYAFEQPKSLQQSKSFEQPMAASADDDLPEQKQGRKMSPGVVLASFVMFAGAALIGLFMYFLSTPAPEINPVPQSVVAPARPSVVVPAVPAPSLTGISPPEKTKAEQAPTSMAAPASISTASPVSMGTVSSELVPPTTDGLSPARRIGTIRIQLDGDREITQQR